MARSPTATTALMIATSTTLPASTPAASSPTALVTTTGTTAPTPTRAKIKYFVGCGIGRSPTTSRRRSIASNRGLPTAYNPTKNATHKPPTAIHSTPRVYPIGPAHVQRRTRPTRSRSTADAFAVGISNNSQVTAAALRAKEHSGGLRKRRPAAGTGSPLRVKGLGAVSRRCGGNAIEGGLVRAHEHDRSTHAFRRGISPTPRRPRGS